MTSDWRSFRRFEKTSLIVPACHDTASAIAAIPAAGDDWAFISSGHLVAGWVLCFVHRA